MAALKTKDKFTYSLSNKGGLLRRVENQVLAIDRSWVTVGDTGYVNVGDKGDYRDNLKDIRDSIIDQRDTIITQFNDEIDKLNAQITDIEAL